MTAARPTIAPQVLADLVAATPDRVRRRLDREPAAAAQWNWQADDDGWAVETGGETVRLPQHHVSSIDQVRCSCLLAPRCFHVLACVTSLAVSVEDDGTLDAAADDAASATSDDNTNQAASAGGATANDSAEELRAATVEQRGAATDMARAVEQLLRVGLTHAGVVVQSAVLRATHQCRAEGLHRAAALGLRVIAGTNEIRRRATEADPQALATDLADLLDVTWRLQGDRPVPDFWFGTARRAQFPVRPRKLHGLLAEPIVTRSGFTGAAAYLVGEDGRIYSAADVRPGDVQRARDAYHGGIEIGSLVQPAKQLARGLYLGTDLTASRDGRLGKGTSVRIVEQGSSEWNVEAIQRLFARPLIDQWKSAYEWAALPADARPAGWDFVFLTGEVVGAVGPELVLTRSCEPSAVRLAIELDHPALAFRENLRMLAHAPGLMLRVIGRLKLDDPTRLFPLAVSNAAELPNESNAPRLELADALGGRVCLGFDVLQRKNFTQAQPGAVVLSERHSMDATDDPLAALTRRWIASMLGGSAQRSHASSSVAAEVADLRRHGFATGALLHDALAHGDRTRLLETFLAAALYLREGRFTWARSLATWNDAAP